MDATQQLVGVKKQMAELEPKAKRLDELVALSKTDVLQFLEAHGLTYHDVASAKAKSLGTTAPPAPPKDAPPPVDLKPFEEKLTGIEKRIADGEAAKQREAQEGIAREIEQYIAGIGEAIKADAVKYPLLSEFPNSASVVFERIKSHLKEHGKMLKPEEAAPLVEEETRAELVKYRDAHPNLFRALTPESAAPAQAAPTGEAPSGARGRRVVRPAAPATIPVAIAKPVVTPTDEVVPPRRGEAPGGRKMLKGESFAEYMTRMGK